MDDQGNVGRIVAAIRLSRDMDVGLGILREVGEEKFKEFQYIIRSRRVLEVVEPSDE